jgi:cell wall-associated NlpC family hydrolase
LTERLDPRTHAFRDDLAALSLEGRVAAPRFVAGTTRQVVAASAVMAEAPRADARTGSEALFGERFTVYDQRDGWAWGQLETDNYVGYVPADALGEPGAPPTHRVAVPRTCLYPRPDLKSCPVRLVSLNARLAVTGRDGEFVVLAGDAGYVFARHVAPMGVVAPDHVIVAEAFLATPYMWGGRQSLGLDCSGLVQLCLDAAGIACPRDSDMQEQVGVPVDIADLTALERGDLVFWKGHVGIMVDATRLLHASGHHMLVVIEPLAAAAMRNAEAGLPVTAVRRLEKTAG